MLFKSFKLVALIFIEAFDIYYKLAFIPHMSVSDDQKQRSKPTKARPSVWFMIQIIKDSQVC